MNGEQFLESVKKSLNITGDYQNETLLGYISETVAFLVDSGVKSKNITPGIVSRGVSDLWNYGASDGKLSDYFKMRASQLAYKT